jgi:hypothetical protein
MAFTMMYNRTTNHIAGAAIRSTGDGSRPEDALNACGALTRARLATGKNFTTAADALKGLKSSAAATGRKVCKHCESALNAEIA